MAAEIYGLQNVLMGICKFPVTGSVALQRSHTLVKHAGHQRTRKLNEQMSLLSWHSIGHYHPFRCIYDLLTAGTVWYHTAKDAHLMDYCGISATVQRYKITGE